MAAGSFRFKKKLDEIQKRNLNVFIDIVIGCAVVICLGVSKTSFKQVNLFLGKINFVNNVVPSKFSRNFKYL